MVKKFLLWMGRRDLRTARKEGGNTNERRETRLLGIR